MNSSWFSTAGACAAAAASLYFFTGGGSWVFYFPLPSLAAEPPSTQLSFNGHRDASDLSIALSLVPDWWALSLSDLERIATALIGPFPGGWVRQGDNFVRVGGVDKYGAEARRLHSEVTALFTETKRIRVDGRPASSLRAAAFCHLRFENIHPLCEANGRIGRVTLAGQLQQSLNFPMADTFNGLKDWDLKRGQIEYLAVDAFEAVGSHVTKHRRNAS